MRFLVPAAVAGAVAPLPAGGPPPGQSVGAAPVRATTPPLASWKTLVVAAPSTTTLVSTVPPNNLLGIEVRLAPHVEPVGAYAFELRVPKAAARFGGATDLQGGSSAIFSPTLIADPNDTVVRVAWLGRSNPAKAELFRVLLRVEPTAPARFDVTLTDDPGVELGAIVLEGNEGWRVPHLVDDQRTRGLALTINPIRFPNPTPVPPPAPLRDRAHLAAILLGLETPTTNANGNLDTTIDAADFRTAP